MYSSARQGQSGALEFAADFSGAVPFPDDNLCDVPFFEDDDDAADNAAAWGAERVTGFCLRQGAAPLVLGFPPGLGHALSALPPVPDLTMGKGFAVHVHLLLVG
jgi:hypothetical protein